MVISFKTDEDNDIYELTVNNKVYNIDNVYESPYGDLFDELNIAVDLYTPKQIQKENKASKII